VLRSNKLLTCQSDAIFLILNLFSFHLISSQRSFSWKLLIASHCHHGLCHPVSSQLISSHVFSASFTSSHLIPSHVFSLFLIFSQLTTDLSFSHLVSSHLSLSQIFSDFLSSPQLMSAHVMSSHLFSKSSHIFLALPTSPQLISALVSSSHLISAPRRTLRSSQLVSGTRPAPKTDLGAKASGPYAFHRKDLTQRSFYTRQAFAQRSLYAQKLLHRDREAFTQVEAVKTCENATFV